MKAKKIKPGFQSLENRVLLPPSCHMDKIHVQFMPCINLQIILYNKTSFILKGFLVKENKFANRFGSCTFSKEITLHFLCGKISFSSNNINPRILKIVFNRFVDVQRKTTGQKNKKRELLIDIKIGS